MAVQERDVVFALDIGTRSIVGVLGREEGGRLHVLDIEKEEHGRRAMLDGQIEDIAQVAAIARIVVERLEARQHIRLQRVCVAAAGRALRSARASFTLEFSESREATDETVSQLEAGAVSAAESTISGGEGGFYMVGYTPAQYRLDGYPLSTLHGHHGRVMEVDVVATFLPREVVDSLYAVVSRLGLEVSSLTLEPIASLNAAIPVDIRLLNLVLVDIGAGTSDIAVCRSGSVAGYTMATVAGDEVTELLMKQLLIDFRTGEALKMGIGGPEPLRYTDILGIVHECTSAQLIELIGPAVELLAGEIAQKVLELNGGVPSAVFLAGGGSKLYGLRAAVAEALGMDDARVAIAGNHFEKNAFSDEYALGDPEYSTPLGIAISSALGMIHDSYVVTLNGAPAKLFRSGTLNVRDVLLMNGCSYSDLMGRTGANLAYTLNGVRQFVRGAPGTPPVLRLNGEEAELTAVVHAGDNVEFRPARAGANASRTLGEALGEGFSGSAAVNGEPQPMQYLLCTGDAIETNGVPMPVRATAPVREAEPDPAPAPEAGLPVRAHATVHTAGEPLEIDVPVARRMGAKVASTRRQKLAFSAPELPAQETDGGVAEPQPEKPATARASRPASARRRAAAQPAQTVPAAEPQAEGQLSLEAVAPAPVTQPVQSVAAAELVEQSRPESAAEAAPSMEEPAAAPVPVTVQTDAPPAAEPSLQDAEAPAPAAPVVGQSGVDDAVHETVEETGAQREEAAETAVEQPPVAASVPARGPAAPRRRGVPRVILPDLPEFTVQKPAQPVARPLTIRLNGAPLALPPKADGEPYYFMDVLQHSGLDFGNLQRPVELLLNGAACDFRQKLAEDDDVVVRYQD